MDFRIRQLQCFGTLSENLNYGKTARMLYMSQPTITFQIQSLEDALGAKLFERNRKSVRLTAQGKAMVKYARSILAIVEESREHLRSMQEPQRLCVSFGLNSVSDLLPRVLRMLAKHYPSFELDAVDLTTEEKIEMLEGGRIDAVVMTRKLPVQGARFVPLTTAPVCAIVSRQHPFAQQGCISIHDLDGECILVTRPEDCRLTRPWVEDILRSHGVEVTLVNTPQPCSIQMAYVAAGVGVVFAPVLDRCEGRTDVVALAIREEIPQLELGCMVQKDDFREAIVILERVLSLCIASTETALP